MFRSPLAVPKPVGQQADQWQTYPIEDFSGGLNTADPASALRKDQFTAMTNYYHQPNRTLIVRGPYRPWLVASEDTILSTAPLTFAIVELRGSDYRVACWDSGSAYSVSVYDEVNNRWAGTGGGTAIKTDLTDGYKVRFVKYSVNEAEDLIFCNGKDTPQRWVGTVDTASADLGLTVPVVTSMSASESDGLTESQRGITDSGTYYYKFTNFYDDSGTSTKYGESGPSSAVSVTVTNAVASPPHPVAVTISSIPTLPTGVSKVFIYRSYPDRSEGPFRYVGYTSATEYTDNMPNDEEGVEIPLDAGTPPKLKNIIEFDGRIWGIGLSSTGALTNKGVWSRKGNPDYYDALAFFYFPDSLIGPKAFRRDVYWFTERQIYVSPDGDVNKTPLKICDIGCDSYDSITDVGTGLVWQYNGNIYWSNFNDFNPVTGDLPWPIGDPIKNKIAAIPTAQRTNSTGCFHKDRYYLSFTGPNQTHNTSTLVWDIKHGTRLLQQGLTGAWSLMDWAANDLQSFDRILYSADHTNKYIMEHDFAGTADYHSKTEYTASTSYNLTSQLATGDLHFGQEWADKVVNSLSLAVESSGVSIIAALSFNNTEFNRTKTFTLGSGTLPTDSTWLVWNEGTWGNFNWGETAWESGTAFQSAHKQLGKGGKGRNAKLTLESQNSQDTKLIMGKLYYKELPSPA